MRPCVLHCFLCNVLQCFPLAVFSHHQRATIGHNMPKYAKIGHKGLNKQNPPPKKKRQKKQRFLEIVGIGGMSLFFFCFFWFFSGPKGRMQRVESFHAPREGCRELSLVICFSSCQAMHMSKQRMCKEECKKRTLTVPCSGERGTVRVRFFSLMLHQDIIYMPAMLLQDLIYMIDIYIYMHTSKISSSWVTRNKTYCTCTARN